MLKFFIPIAAWCLLFFPQLSAKVPISSETLHLYSVIKFYIDNLKLGVFPLWDPFVMWGAPTQIFLNYAGVFNPLWLLSFVLNAIGISFYGSFLILIVIYFWIGLWGFYLLAKLILKDKNCAYLAFLLLLFSSLSMSLFSQYHTPLIYIPSIWFFYFLISFFKNPTRKALAGMTFAGALILTAYLPFYFITVFILVAISSGIFYLDLIKASLPSIAEFFRKNVFFSFAALFVVVFAAVPGYLAYQSTAKEDVVAPFRNENIMKKTGVHFDEYEKVSRNGFASRMDLEDLYSNLGLIQYGDDCFFYISIFIYGVLALGALTRINRFLAVLGFIAVVLFFLMMASATGFHRFVFEHVGYFKLIRNMHFFLPFLIGVVVLYVSEQFRVLNGTIRVMTKKKRTPFIILVILMHLGGVIFLCFQESILVSSYAAIVLSMIFWVLSVRYQAEPNKKIIFVVLFLAITAQPLEVIFRHNNSVFNNPFFNIGLIKESVSVPTVKPVFKYARPVSDRELGNDDTAYSRILMRDASRFFQNGFPTYWAYDLAKTGNFSEIQKFTKNKFYVFGKQVEVIEKDSENFKILEFTVNSIKIRTNFPENKKLLYTDSYHRDWKAFVNGSPVRVERTNIAFKGIDIPSGENIVDFKYCPGALAAISVLLSILLCINLIYLLAVRP